MNTSIGDNKTFPKGTTWTPVETALNDLKKSLSVNLVSQKIDVIKALGFVLSKDVVAKRSNPHSANTAVDGFGFAYKSIEVSVNNRIPSLFIKFSRICTIQTTYVSCKFNNCTL